MQRLSCELPIAIFVCSPGIDFRFLKPFVFSSVFISRTLENPLLSLPTRSLDVFAHIRLFVAHCYLPLAVVSIFVPVPYNRIVYSYPKTSCVFYPQDRGQLISHLFHSTVFHPLPLGTPMPINIPTLKRKPNEEDDVLTKQRNEAMVHMAKLAYERMKRIDGEDHERGLKEHQYNNSVKYQRMVEYELNNPGETATVCLEQFIPIPGVTVRENVHSRLCMTGSTRVRSNLQEVEEETS